MSDIIFHTCKYTVDDENVSNTLDNIENSTKIIRYDVNFEQFLMVKPKQKGKTDKVNDKNIMYFDDNLLSLKLIDKIWYVSVEDLNKLYEIETGSVAKYKRFIEPPTKKTETETESKKEGEKDETKEKTKDKTKGEKDETKTNDKKGQKDDTEGKTKAKPEKKISKVFDKTNKWIKMEYVIQYLMMFSKTFNARCSSLLSYMLLAYPYVDKLSIEDIYNKLSKMEYSVSSVKEKDIGLYTEARAKKEEKEVKNKYLIFKQTHLYYPKAKDAEINKLILGINKDETTFDEYSKVFGSINLKAEFSDKDAKIINSIIKSKGTTNEISISTKILEENDINKKFMSYEYRELTPDITFNDLLKLLKLYDKEKKQTTLKPNDKDYDKYYEELITNEGYKDIKHEAPQKKTKDEGEKAKSGTPKKQKPKNDDVPSDEVITDDKIKTDDGEVSIPENIDDLSDGEEEDKQELSIETDD